MTAGAYRPLWLITLADLALLLLGFMLLIHATGVKDARDREALGSGIRQAFGGDAATAPAAQPPAIALDLNRIDFVAGSEDLAGSAQPLVDWAAEAAADRRSKLVITGEADPAEGLALAARRAAVLADLLAADGRVAPERLRLDARTQAGAHGVSLSVSYAH